MTLIERAYSLGDEQKLRAKQIYKKALHRTAQSFGKWSSNNAHTQLSIEFGELWVLYVEGGKFDVNGGAILGHGSDGIVLSRAA